MRRNIIIKTMSILVIVTTIFIIILYEPNIKNNDVSKLEEAIADIAEENVEEPYLYTDKEILQGNNSDVLILSLDNIIDNLTLDERNVVKGILAKLSVIDCAKVNSILNNSSIDPKNEALEYIKKRLVKEDYERLKSILNQYIDLV